MYRQLFLVMIEAQNKSCNLGYTTVHAVFVHLYCINPQPCPQGRGGGLGINWKVETLKVSSTCLVRLLKIYWILLKKNGKLFTMFVNQNILARAYTDKILKTLCIHK